MLKPEGGSEEAPVRGSGVQWVWVFVEQAGLCVYVCVCVTNRGRHAQLWAGVVPDAAHRPESCQHASSAVGGGVSEGLVETASEEWRKEGTLVKKTRDGSCVTVFYGVQM